MKVRGVQMSLAEPVVMGILNCTPDSFYAGSRKQTEQEIAERAQQILAEGGRIIDVGAYSTRPGHEVVSEEEEMQRLHSPRSARCYSERRHVPSTGSPPLRGGMGCRHGERCEPYSRRLFREKRRSEEGHVRGSVSIGRALYPDVATANH